MSFELINDAHVEVTKVINPKKQVEAKIIVDGKYEHQFSHNSRVSKHLDLMEPTDLAERLSGGKFFFIDDQLVDFRDRMYNGFVHDNQTIGKFMDVLGYQDLRQTAPVRRPRNMATTTSQDIVLSRVWNDAGIKVPFMLEGGEFSSRLSFTWNPFVRTVNSAFELVRLICTNGMVGLTSFLNSRVPVVNRWEEHLDIAARQIQTKVDSIVGHRVQTMTKQTATIADCLLLEQHCFDRAYGKSEDGTRSEEERTRLRNMMAVVSPKLHLSNVYRPEVFNNKNVAAQLPSHLTQFDVFNITTELRSHTGENAKSTGNALDRLANRLLFDQDSTDDPSRSVAALSSNRLSSFSNSDQAFFGTIEV